MEAKFINPFIVRESKVTLWHGTSNCSAMASRDEAAAGAANRLGRTAL